MQYTKDFQSNAQGQEYLPGTDTEVFSLGETVKLVGGLLTIADVTSAGEQQYVVTGDGYTGDGVTPEIPCIKISGNNQFRTISTATVAKTLIGSRVTLDTDAIRVTATTTAGVFEIDETDGATTNSVVLGHFVGTGAV